MVKLLQEKGMEENKIEKVWNERVGNPETNQAIIEQLTIWKLAYGLTFLCLKIEVIEDEYKSMNLINNTWLDKL